jgi:hypothetical protein
MVQHNAGKNIIFLLSVKRINCVWELKAASSKPKAMAAEIAADF